MCEILSSFKLISKLSSCPSTTALCTAFLLHYSLHVSFHANSYAWSTPLFFFSASNAQLKEVLRFTKLAAPTAPHSLGYFHVTRDAHKLTAVKRLASCCGWRTHVPSLHIAAWRWAFIACGSRWAWNRVRWKCKKSALHKREPLHANMRLAERRQTTESRWMKWGRCSTLNTWLEVTGQSGHTHPVGTLLSCYYQVGELFCVCRSNPDKHYVIFSKLCDELIWTAAKIEIEHQFTLWIKTKH